MLEVQHDKITTPLEAAPPELNELASIADAHAFEIWGEDVAHGEPIAVSGAAGEISGYLFPYALGVRQFPEGEIAEADPAMRFGTLQVAARATGAPVTRIIHGLHPAFLKRGEAAAAGCEALGGEAQLTRLYCLGPHQEYFEVATAGKHLLLDVATLEPAPAETAMNPCGAHDPPFGADITAHAAPGPPPRIAAAVPVLKLVPFPDCVPAVNWTWWCVPTAFTMAACYWDNFVKGVGGQLGYGRLVGYWFDHPKSGHNVPDFIDQLVDPKIEDWRKGFNGFADFVAKTYGYPFSTRDVKAGAANDWAWADIVAEIDAGRPFVWGWPDHAVCAFGYRVLANGARYVVCHTTWGDTPQQQRQERLHTEGTGLGAIIPAGATAGQDVVLWAPDGGEMVLTNVPVTVQWHVWGDQIKLAEVLVSADGGNTWTSVAMAAPCTPGWNVHTWTPQIVTDRARLRIRCFDAAGRYIAGDGSQQNFKVAAGPRAVALKSIYIKSRTNSVGFFSAQHGLERFTPDGLSIRAISVAVQHKNGNWHALELSNSVDNRFWWNKDVVEGVIGSPNFFEQPVQIVVFAEPVVG